MEDSDCICYSMCMLKTYVVYCVYSTVILLIKNVTSQISFWTFKLSSKIVVMIRAQNIQIACVYNLDHVTPASFPNISPSSKAKNFDSPGSPSTVCHYKSKQ